MSKRIKMILRRLLYPPKWVLFSIPPASFAMLIFIFTAGKQESLPSYIIYLLSAYSLVVFVVALPELIKKQKLLF